MLQPLRRTALLALSLAACSSPPRGERGPEADRLATEMMKAVRADAWERTGAIAFVFRGEYRHVWDRVGRRARVEWDDGFVVLDLERHRGRAFAGGKELGGDAARERLLTGYKRWVNDTFWLNPVVKVFDDGVERELVRDGAERGLLVRYTSGGVTPGDVYVWWLGEDLRPRRWQMWVSILPVKGATATWEGWTELSTGAWVSTRHELAVARLEITDVRAALRLEDLEMTSVFDPLTGCDSVECPTYLR